MMGRGAIDISPEEFELEVREQLTQACDTLHDFQATHRETLMGIDGEYEIDIVVRFTALKVAFLVLVECKRHKNPIKREVVESLQSRVLSMGAQKGMIYATTSFQSGAIEYAARHGIALISLVDGVSTYMTRSIEPAPPPPPWLDIPKYSGWIVYLTDEGNHGFSLVSRNDTKYLRAALFGGCE